MFALKSENYGQLPVSDVVVESLSSYDISVYLSYEDPDVKQDAVMRLRYEGTDGESLFETALCGNRLCEFGLKCFNKNAEEYDAPWTVPDTIKSAPTHFLLTMDDEECEVRLGKMRIDQYLDFKLIIYKDTIVTLFLGQDISSAIKFHDTVYVLLNRARHAIGYAIRSESDAIRLKQTYGIPR